jgi:divalent metal cation (Fe/Co/Zn/Cd) transporter
MLASSLVAGYQSLEKFLHPQVLRDVGWVMAAAVVGFAGNETVATLRIRMGRRMGSAALLADGQHARVDGWTSLAVLLGAIGSLLGFHLVDALIGLLITIAILLVVKNATISMWRRLEGDRRDLESLRRD